LLIGVKIFLDKVNSFSGLQINEGAKEK